MTHRVEGLGFGKKGTVLKHGSGVPGGEHGYPR